MKPQSYLTFLSVALIALAVGLASGIQQVSGDAPARAQTMSCTFTADYPVISLRSGPGTSYERTGSLRLGETLTITGRDVGSDGYVWWKATDDWVRSDLGTSDCPSLCGDTVCEYGETASGCASDCAAKAPALTSTGEGCVVTDCEACYKSIDCYPNCTNCGCWLNEYGCVTCECDAADGTTTTDTTSSTTTATGTGCDFASCEDCYAAFPCWPTPCTKNECTLNEYGCPTCTTAP